MEEGHLVEFLPQDEKHSVQILDALGDEVPPQSSSHLREREKTIKINNKHHPQLQL